MSNRPKKKASRKPRTHEAKAPRPTAAPISDLEKLRQEALLDIGNAFRELLPSAIESAQRGKPAQLRMIARWFRMPAPLPARAGKEADELQELRNEVVRLTMLQSFPEDERTTTPTAVQIKMDNAAEKA